MSVPFKVFSCSHCDYESSDLVLRGLFCYQGSFGSLSIERQLGWCQECGQIVAIEDLPNQQKIEKEHADITEKKQYIEKYLYSMQENRSWIKKLFGLTIKPPSEIESLKSECSYMELNLKEKQKALPIMEQRKSPPRCLYCGTVNCFSLPKLPKIPSPEYPLFSNKDPGPPIEIGFKHPGCGGNILVRFSEVRLSLGNKHRIYDLEGRFIQEIKE